jgi:hypothetical protein
MILNQSPEVAVKVKRLEGGSKRAGLSLTIKATFDPDDAAQLDEAAEQIAGVVQHLMPQADAIALVEKLRTEWQKELAKPKRKR